MECKSSKTTNNGSIRTKLITVSGIFLISLTVISSVLMLLIIIILIIWGNYHWS